MLRGCVQAFKLYNYNQKSNQIKNDTIYNPSFFPSESGGLQRRLEHYDTVWKSYEEIYMQQENAQELMKWQLEVLQRKEAVKEGRMQIAHLQKAEDAVQEEICASKCVDSVVLRLALI